jgi:hypothetical protein
LRTHGELGQAAHVAHIVCGKPHLTPHAFCIGRRNGRLLRNFLSGGY